MRKIIPLLGICALLAFGFQAQADAPKGHWLTAPQGHMRMTVDSMSLGAVHVELCALRHLRTTGLHVVLELADGTRLAPSPNQWLGPTLTSEAAREARSGKVQPGTCVDGWIAFDVPWGGRPVAFVALTTPEMRWSL